MFRSPLLSQAKRWRALVENYAMKSIATVAGVLGIARLADANFLKAKAEPIKEVKKFFVEYQFFKR